MMPKKKFKNSVALPATEDEPDYAALALHSPQAAFVSDLIKHPVNMIESKGNTKQQEQR